MNPNRFATHSLQDARIVRILVAALDAVEPGAAVRKYFESNPLDDSSRIFGLAIGKASLPMLKALADLYPLSRGLAIPKHASSLDLESVTVIQGGHPIPDARSLKAGNAVLDFVSPLNEHDLLLCLISGGGSALVTAPYAGISLEDMQTLTRALLSCGARIDEINTLRRHLDRVKGGGVARATKAKIISLILSDVIGNSLEAIASGPTVPNPTTNKDALAILRKYGIEDQCPSSIFHYLTSNEETASSWRDSPLIAITKTQNVIIGDNRLAAQAALEQAQREGFYSEILTDELQGEARDVGKVLAKQLRDEIKQRPRPFCLIAGGETTVTLRRGSGQALHGNGKGGRNQELALAAVDELRDLQNVMLITLATDGDDGPTDAAGAVVTGESAQRAESLGLSAESYLSRNDSYSYFEILSDLLKPGPSGTNVNDLTFLLGL